MGILEKGRAAVGYGNVWLVEGHLILVRMWGAWTDDDLRAFDEHACRILETINVPLVHIIFESSELESVPSIKALRDVRSRTHPRAGWSLEVGVHNPILRFVMSAAAQMVKNRIRFFPSLADAVAFIQDVDSTLPDLSQLDLKAAYAQAKQQWILPVQADQAAQTSIR